MRRLSLALALALAVVLLSALIAWADPPPGTGRAYIDRAAGDCYMIYCPPGGDCSWYAGKFSWFVSRSVPGHATYQCHADLGLSAAAVHASWSTSVAPGCSGKANLQGRAAEWVEQCEGYWAAPW